MSEPVVLATRNVGKVVELRPLFASHGIEVVDLAAMGLAEERSDEAGIECFATFEENALAKARYFRAATGGYACVADDSGLEVFALGGEPGVRSRRWAAPADATGPEVDAANNARLVRELHGAVDRRARFVCAAAFADSKREVVTTGAVDGSITDAGRGAQGFGYDPYFYSSELGKTLAEASIAEKQAVSHRARAFSALIREIWGGG